MSSAYRILFAMFVLISSFVVQAQQASDAIITADSVEMTHEIGYGRILDMTYSPNGTTVAIAHPNGVTLYDANAFERMPQRRLPVPEPRTQTVTYNNAGNWLLTVSLTERFDWSAETSIAFLRLWETTNWDVIHEWTVELDDYNTSQNYNATFSPDDRQIAFQNGEKAFVWSVESLPDTDSYAERSWWDVQPAWDGMLSSRGIRQNNMSLIYTDDSITLTYDAAAGSFTVETADERITLPENNEVEQYSLRTARVNRSRTTLVATYLTDGGGSWLSVFDLNTYEEIFSTDGFVLSAEPHPETQEILYSEYGENLYRWHSQDGSQTVLGNDSAAQIQKVAWHPHEPLLALVRGQYIEFWDAQQAIRLDTLAVRSAEDIPQTIRNATFTSDGDYLMLYGSTLTIIDVTHRQIIAAIPSTDRRFVDAAISLSQNLVATYTVEITVPDRVTLHDIETDDVIARFSTVGNSGLPYGRIAFSPTMNHFVLIDVGRLRVFDSDTLRGVFFEPDDPVHDLPEPLFEFEANLIDPLFSADGRHLVVTDLATDTISLFDPTADYALRGQFRTDLPDELTISYAFLSDRDTLVTIPSFAPTARAIDEQRTYPLVFRDTSTGDEITRIITNHFEPVNDLAVSPDGRWIATAGGSFTCYQCGSYDNYVFIWQTQKP